MMFVRTRSSGHFDLRRALRPAWLVTLALAACSCRSLGDPTQVQSPADDRVATAMASDSASRTAESHQDVPVECVCEQGTPIPITNASPWRPPGIAGPWPHDEYLCDGGDREVQANIGPHDNLRGLELEDTVAVYETVDGDTRIEPSNRVCLYAPRFGAVRQVSGVVQTEQREQPVGFERPVAPKLHQDDQLATTAVQPLQPVGEIGRKQPSIERVGESAVPATSRQPIVDLTGGFATYENLLVMRTGVITDREKPQLIEAIDAAIVWSHDKAVQVVLDGRAAVEVTGDQKAQATFRIDEPDNAALRVIKVASTKVAKPGDVVDFTIRFDNLGDTTIKHLVLVDNLTTRLEYVPGTAQSSRPAEFFTEENEGESLVLTWDFRDPLPIGEGGLVRFHCRVR
jgi:uncharacterized repeat protein (TIGR01451 family)